MAGKPRSRREIEQKVITTRKKPYDDRVLIVCEGKKSEPTYLEDLVDRYGLSTANVVIEGIGSDPGRVVATAKRLEKKERRIGESYDVVYCVFDHDEHEHFNSASQEARDARLKLARSWPCFEYWLVLHFVYHRKPYARSGNKSAAQNCVRDSRSVCTATRRACPACTTTWKTCLKRRSPMRNVPYPTRRQQKDPTRRQKCIYSSRTCNRSNPGVSDDRTQTDDRGMTWQ